MLNKLLPRHRERLRALRQARLERDLVQLKLVKAIALVERLNTRLETWDQLIGSVEAVIDADAEHD